MELFRENSSRLKVLIDWTCKNKNLSLCFFGPLVMPEGTMNSALSVHLDEIAPESGIKNWLKVTVLGF